MPVTKTHASIATGITTQGTGDISLLSGNVGIGDSSPSYKLDVDGDSSQNATFAGKIITTASGALLRKYVSSWTGRENQDVLYQGWTANTSDYIYLKAPGNSSTDHGVAFISDNVIAFESHR